ncbi:VOC family protein [Vibrio sp. S9_S30]|uniref:VOC family protein n=1 Tax=Vibrio sp. S9_S30 TaxID=2720226 RepID=UPI0016813ECC|nr:VOC family protein [Vibrio sp. S9_S30]MBD1559975.1 VOC family protein [Vibrio sp. S9_S30]
MEFNDLIPEFLVSDLSVSERFYVEVLGFKELFRRDGFVFLSFNETQLMLTQLQDSLWVNGELEAPFGRGVNLTYKVTANWLSALKVDEESLFLPLEKESYKTGETMTVVEQLIVKDPDGYLIRFLCQQNG